MSSARPWVVTSPGPLNHSYGSPSSTLLMLTDSFKSDEGCLHKENMKLVISMLV